LRNLGEKNKKARWMTALCLVVKLAGTSERGLPAFSFGEEKAAETLPSSSRCHNQGAFLALV
jgi:hypothetical protein